MLIKCKGKKTNISSKWKKSSIFEEKSIVQIFISILCFCQVEKKLNWSRLNNLCCITTSCHGFVSDVICGLVYYIIIIKFSVLKSSAVDHRFEPRSGQTKDYKIGICCFSAIKHAALRRKSKDWLTRNQDYASEWGDRSTCGLLFQWASTIKNPTQRVGLE